MEVCNEVIIDAPAERVWHVLGARFMHMGDWAAPVRASCALGPSEPGVGAARGCSHGPVGPIPGGVVTERLTRFAPDDMAFEYEAIEGLPRFIERAANRWSVEHIDDHSCLVRAEETVTLRGLLSLFACPIRWQLGVVGARVLEELKYFVEEGRPHPRKLAAAGEAARSTPD